MQIIPAKNNYIEKIIQDQNGRLVRATFCVYEIGGRVKARLVDVVYLEQDFPAEQSPLILTGLKQTEAFQTEQKEGGIISPYFNLNTLYFSGSKPRAPTI